MRPNTEMDILTLVCDITHCDEQHNDISVLEELLFKGQMHHHDDLGSKCAYTCHFSNKTTCKSVLLSTPQIWLMKVSKKEA